MKYVHIGWLRLWVVASLLAIPTMAALQFQEMQATWDRLDALSVKICSERSLRNNEDSLECLEKSGAYKTIFEKEKSTPFGLWSGFISISFVIDIFASLIIIIFYKLFIWVLRGFKKHEN